MDWIQANVSFIYVPDLVYLDKNKNLDTTFSSLTNILMNAAKINASYVESLKLGTCTKDGVFDGLIGKLERNETDFSIFYRSTESIMDTRCKLPVTFDSIYSQQSNHILSSPVINVTKSVKSVHEAFLVFDRNVTLFMISIYFLSAYLLSKSAFINKSSRKIWTLTRIWFNQDANDGVLNIQSEKVILSTSKILIFHFIILVSVCVNTDLMTYSKPQLIDSVSDAISSKIRIAFPATSDAYPIVNAAPKGSEAKKLLMHARNQSKTDLFFFDNIKAGTLIKEHKLLSVFTQSAIEISRLVDCFDTDAKQYYHGSRDAVFHEHGTTFFSRACNSEIRNRINKFNVKLMETGLIQKDVSDQSPNIVSILFDGAMASVSCVNQGRDERQLLNNHIIAYRDSIKFIRLMGCLYCTCFSVLIIEMIQSILQKSSKKKCNRDKRRIRRKRRRLKKPPFDMNNHRNVMRRAREIDRIILTYYYRNGSRKK